MASVEDIIDHMIDEWEGKFSLHPHDRGGTTNFGVTQTVYSEYLGRPASVEEVRLMPRAHAVRIYRSRYWDKPGIGRLPEALQAVVFDMAVNMGPKTAIRLLQQTLNGLGRAVATDGVIGKITSGVAARAVADLGAGAVVNAVCDRRAQYYRNIVARDPSQAVFERGWLRRCDSYRLPD